MSKIHGTNKLRRTLRRIDPELTDELRVSIRETSEAVVADALRFVPIDEGDLARSIDYKLGRDGFTSVIGPGAKAAELVRRKSRIGSAFGKLDKKGRRIKLNRTNRHLYRQFLKGLWIEFGTKGNPSKNIPRRPPRAFMGRAWALNRPWALRRSRKALQRALDGASRG